MEKLLFEKIENELKTSYIWARLDAEIFEIFKSLGVINSIIYSFMDKKLKQEEPSSEKWKVRDSYTDNKKNETSVARSYLDNNYTQNYTKDIWTFTVNEITICDSSKKYLLTLISDNKKELLMKEWLIHTSLFEILKEKQKKERKKKRILDAVDTYNNGIAWERDIFNKITTDSEISAKESYL